MRRLLQRCSREAVEAESSSLSSSYASAAAEAGWSYSCDASMLLGTQRAWRSARGLESDQLHFEPYSSAR